MRFFKVASFLVGPF